jgi:hypothetical protein
MRKIFLAIIAVSVPIAFWLWFRMYDSHNSIVET